MQRPPSREHRENNGGNKKKAQISVPTSNDNLAEFEKVSDEKMMHGLRDIQYTTMILLGSVT